MTTMTHDGYVATIELDEDAGLFHGQPPLGQTNAG
jgi:predicted HicB family RNase H-like nuclease